MYIYVGVLHQSRFLRYTPKYEKQWGLAVYSPRFLAGHHGSQLLRQP
jgi:hypothetical protein